MAREVWVALRRLLAVAFVLGGVPAVLADETTGATAADPFVCAQAVIAIDASRSTESGAFERQLTALAEAFREDRLAAAVQDCLPGSFGVALMTWAGPGDQRVCAPWTTLRSAEDLEAVAEAIEGCSYHGGTTDVGAAVAAGTALLELSPFLSHYRIVFLLTNGRTDEGAEPRLEAARRQAELAGVTVLGHALLSHKPQFWKAPRSRHDPFRRWVEIRVTTGPRAFTTASDPDEDAGEILDALIRMLRQELH